MPMEGQPHYLYIDCFGENIDDVTLVAGKFFVWQDFWKNDIYKANCFEKKETAMAVTQFFFRKIMNGLPEDQRKYLTKHLKVREHLLTRRG